MGVKIGIIYKGDGLIKPERGDINIPEQWVWPWLDLSYTEFV